MAARGPARLTAAEGREFGLTVGGAFAVLAAAALWRGRHASAVVLGALAAALLLGALAAPAALGPAERAWSALARAISQVTTPIMLGLVYFAVFTPIALLMRAARRDVLGLRRGRRGAGTWVVRPPGAQRSDLERQF